MSRQTTPALLIAAMLCLGSFAHAGFDGVDALKIPPTARDACMGGIHAMSVGPESIFYNPAGFGNLLRPTVSLTHTQLYSDVRLDALSLIYPLKEGWGRLGLSVLALTMPPIDGYDTAGQKNGSFTAMDTVLGLSWAGEFRYGEEGHGRAGITAKRIEQRIASMKASGMAADLGVQGNLSAMPRINFGFGVENLGPEMKFDSESYSLPLTISLGAGYILGDRLLLQVGANQRPNASRTTAGGGAEFWVIKSVALRAGYAFSKSNVPSDNPSALSGLGAGVGWRPLRGAFRFDYAFAPGVTDLGMIHRVTVGFEFGRRRDTLPEPKWASKKPKWKNFWVVINPWDGD